MKQILCFGDSNTYGLIPGTTNQRYGWGTRWTSILDDKVRTKGYRVIEEGLCGRTTVFDDPFRTERRGTEMLPAILESHSSIIHDLLELGTFTLYYLYTTTKSCYLGTRRYQGGIAMSFFLYPNGLLSKKAIIHRRGIPAM